MQINRLHDFACAIPFTAFVNQASKAAHMFDLNMFFAQKYCHVCRPTVLRIYFARFL